MNPTLPGLKLTGASGFVGRNFIKAATGKFRLYCIAEIPWRQAECSKKPISTGSRWGSPTGKKSGRQ